MANNPLNDLKPQVNLHRNGFDLSRKSVFSVKAGMVLPCLAIETVPRGYYEIKPNDFLRTFPLKTDAFLRLNQELLYTFTANQSIWRQFNTWYTQRGTKVSSLEKGSLFHPRFSLGYLLDYMYTKFLDSTTRPQVYGALRLLDLLGYGNYTPYFEGAWYNNWDDLFDGTESHLDDRMLNPFRIAAYNRVWFDLFRNKNFDLDVNPVLFNFDDLDCTSVATSIVSSERIYQMLTIRYCAWKRDLFMNLMPTQQFGDVSVVSATTPSDSINYSGVTRGLVVDNGQLGVGGIQVVNNISGSQVNVVQSSKVQNVSLTSSFDIIALRRSEAIQKWRENQIRAGQGNISQFVARGLGKPNFELDGSPVVLGSCQAAVNINAVTNTSMSGGVLGDLAGQGSSAVNGNVDFQCSDFGVILGLFYIRPNAEYSSSMIDRLNTVLTREEYFTPELMNLGLESVHRYQLTTLPQPARYDADGRPLLDGQSLAMIDAAWNNTLGYSARYSYYKAAVDKVYGQFGAWSGHQQVDNQSEYALKGGFNSDWVAPRVDLENLGFLQIRNFYVDPAVFNNTFLRQVDATEESDQFIVNMYHDIKAVLPMSVVGLDY